MQSKPLTPVALLFMLLLLGQAFTGHLNQIPGEERNTELDFSNIVMFSNNTTDSDGDGIYDYVDACPNGNSSWTSSYYTDHDSDGCQDSNEDLDDDSDGILDAFDSCPVGSLGWTSTNSTDYDSDGCRDSSEDSDDDNDGVSDGYDSCPKGELGWISSNTTDADGDGCRDSTEDSDGGGTGGNQTSPCGSNVNYTSVYAYAPYMVMENQSFMTSMYVNCEILNATMTLDYWIYDSSNSTLFSGNQSWNGTNSSSTNYTAYVSGLSAGYYVFHADLYVDGTLVDSDSDSFMVYANSSGGGGSGGNQTSPCGSNVNYTSVYAYAPYMVMENQSFMTSMYANCEILNAAMTLDYWIYDSSNSTLFSGNQSWNGTNSSSTNYSWSVTGLAAGYYTFHADLYVDGTLVDSDSDSFMVYANSSGGGGSGGNQTSPCGSNVNYASVYAYAPYMVVENQSFMTSMYVNCEILNATMTLDYWVYDSSNSTLFSGNQSWNGTNSSSSNYTAYVSGLTAGYYVFHADLYVNGNWVDSDSDSFMVYANSSGGGGSGGNQTSSCGNNASDVWFEVEADQPEWNASDTVSVFLDTYCGIWNNSYKVSWGLIDNATNSIIDSGNTSFVTNPSSVSYHPNHTYHFNEYDIHLHYMDTGNYTVFGHFSVWSNNSWLLLSNQSYTFEVNSTMTTTVCGFNSTFIGMETGMQSTAYYTGSSVHPWSDIECPMLNTMYTYTWEMYNLNTSTITHAGMQNFTATWQNVNMFTDGSGFYYDLYPHADNLTEGIYILTTTLSSTSGGLVDTNNVSFSVWANPANNTPNGSDCLHLRNISVNSSYYVFVELENSCSIDIHYPGINATTDEPGVSGLYETWWYLLWPNGTYNSGWQLSFNESVQNNTPITLNFSATILNCGPNGYHACPNSINSSSSYQFTYITTSGNNPGGNNTTIDTDGDGIPDYLDSFPMDANETSDYDGDGVGDNADTDDDNDGVADNADAFPNDPTETADTDGDGVGDNTDTDDDNDGVGDNFDAFPLDPSEAFDNDGDGVGDNTDMDDDNDGVADAYDNCVIVFNPNQADADMDGIGTECDADESNGNSGNNTGGNNTGGNTGGNNTGGNTGGNNTGGNNTGGNNTGGNNTGGNNTGGNNTGGNNTGGNNTGGNDTDSNDDGNEIPSLGMLGTVVAISAGFLLSIRRDDEE